MVFRIALLEAHNDMNNADDTSKIDALARLIDQDDTATPEADERDESRTKFADLGLSPALVRALADAGYEYPTAVQVEAIPAAMNNEDLKVASSTGSGKTAAFMLPALERIVAARGEGKRREKGMIHGPRVLVLAPTRELALQSQLVARDDTAWLLRIERESLQAGQTRDKLQLALAQAGHPVSLALEMGRVTDSPAKRLAHAARVRLLSAQQTIEQDPYVQQLMHRYDAKIVQGSIQPL